VDEEDEMSKLAAEGQAKKKRKLAET